MKQLARKKTRLSLVRAASERAETPPDVTASKLKEFFSGWLEAVKPEPSAGNNLNSSTTSTPVDRRHSMTANEVTRVNRATVRESNTHRAWPPEVVEKFLAAEIIKRK